MVDAAVRPVVRPVVQAAPQAAGQAVGQAVGQVLWRATVAYDGSAFHGFQRSPHVPTVQGALESTLAIVNSGNSVSVLGAGRTDAGVHASGQVIAFALEWAHGSAQLQTALNRLLPESIAVREVQPAAVDFHPRYDASSRVYHYTVLVGRIRDVFASRYAWQLDAPPGSLDLNAMNQAAALLIGSHDFASFGTPPESSRGIATTIREILRCKWSSARHTLPDVQRLTLTIQANAFLYHQVRSTAALLVRVGQGKCSVAQVAALLAARDRSQVQGLAPPGGLNLTTVYYNVRDVRIRNVRIKHRSSTSIAPETLEPD